MLSSYNNLRFSLSSSLLIGTVFFWSVYKQTETLRKEKNYCLGDRLSCDRDSMMYFFGCFTIKSIFMKACKHFSCKNNSGMCQNTGCNRITFFSLANRYCVFYWGSNLIFPSQNERSLLKVVTNLLGSWRRYQTVGKYKNARLE